MSDESLQRIAAAFERIAEAVERMDARGARAEAISLRVLELTAKAHEKLQEDI